MAQLFLSYAREDRECAELFARELSARGWTVWWDRRIQVGRSFAEVIERELDAASCVIVLWSRHAVVSPWVQTEAAEAAQRRVLVPVRIEDVRMPLEFRRLHTADLFEWRTRLDGPELEDCLASIELLAPKTISAMLPEQPAAEPQQVTNDASTQNASANVHQSPAGWWVSQDGQQLYAPDLVTLCLWAEEGRVRADSQVYDSSLQQWIRAQEVTGLRRFWQEKAAAPTVATPVASAAKSTLPTTAATPGAPRRSNRARIAFAIAGGVLLLILIIISVVPHPPASATSDTAETDTSTTETVTDTAATDTMATDTMATDTMTTDTVIALTTDTMATVASTDTTTTGAISISLKNECTKTIFVAICYRDSAGSWISRGWFKMAPNDTRTNLLQAYAPNVYFYAEAEGLTWKGVDGDSMTSMIAVHDTDKFMAVIGQLKGDGIKTVPFFGKTVEAGKSEYIQPFLCD